MLIIKPVQDKKLQESYSIKCGAKYDPDSLCYAAWVDDVLVGIAQFRLSGGGKDGKMGRIITLRGALGTDDIDALFIMGRQTMNFIDLSGVHECILVDVFDNIFAEKLGFELVDGEYYVNLDGFFIEPCEHGKANSPR